MTTTSPLFGAFSAAQVEEAIFCAAMAAYLFCCSRGMDEDFKDTMFFFLVLVALATPMAFMVMTCQYGEQAPLFRLLGPRLPFWVSAIEWSVITLFLLWPCAEGWSRVLLLLGATTATVSIFFRLGQTHFLPYAVGPVQEMRSISAFLDARVLLGCLFALLTLATAVVEAFAEGYPDIPGFPLFRLPSPQGRVPQLVALFLTPFFAATNALLLVACRILDVLWRVAATVSIYLARTGIQFVKTVLRLLESRVVPELLRIYGLLISTLVALFLLSRLPWSLALYLKSSAWSVALPLLWTFLLLSGLLYLLSVVSSFLLFTHDFEMKASYESIAALLCALLLSSAPLYLIERFDLLHIQAEGFQQIGPFSAGILCMVGIGMVVVAFGSRNRPRPSVSPAAAGAGRGSRPRGATRARP